MTDAPTRTDPSPPAAVAPPPAVADDEDDAPVAPVSASVEDVTTAMRDLMSAGRE